MNAFQRIVIAIVIAFLGVDLRGSAEEKSGGDFSEGEKLFALQVRNVFRVKCIACHGQDPDDLAGGFDMRSRNAMSAGGDSFGDEVVMAGHGPTSVLYRVVARTEDGYEMPPKDWAVQNLILRAVLF